MSIERGETAIYEVVVYPPRAGMFITCRPFIVLIVPTPGEPVMITGVFLILLII